ncbi:hypothetical protein [Streptomyces sp. NPDC002550]
MTDALRQMAAQGWELSPDDIAALSPHRRDNVLRFGDYDTTTLHIPPARTTARFAFERTASDEALHGLMVDHRLAHLRPWGQLGSGQDGLGVRLIDESAGGGADGYEGGAAPAASGVRGEAVGNEGDESRDRATRL